MKHGLVFATALVLGIQAFADIVKLPSAIETKPHDLDSLLESGHVQGALLVDADEEREKVVVGVVHRKHEALEKGL